MDSIFIYVTVKDEGEAKKVAGVLLEKKLVACANYFPIRSIYHWKGEVKGSEEYVLLLKTKEDNYKIIKQEIELVHSYDVPCITKIKVEPNEKYASWLNSIIS